jgi:hypothetical protein
MLAGHDLVAEPVHHVQTELRATNGWACLQAQPELDDTLKVARRQGQVDIGQW